MQNKNNIPIANEEKEKKNFHENHPIFSTQY